MLNHSDDQARRRRSAFAEPDEFPDLLKPPPLWAKLLLAVVCGVAAGIVLGGAYTVWAVFWR